MSTPQLLLATIVLPGVWGWLVGSCGNRWWKVSERRASLMNAAASHRPTDYEI
jgi:hypothetical protein